MMSPRSSRRVVLISPYFPPSTLAGVHRARHLAKHLPTAGWDPFVICVDPARHAERLDPMLAELVPTRVEIQKTEALPAWLTRLFGIGDVSLRSWLFMRRALMSLLSEGRISAVLITGSPYYQMLLAPEIRRRFQIPVVLDFQDPWISTWGAARSTLSKAGFAHRLAVALEPRALRGADFITSVSQIQNDEMAARHPWLETGRMAAIPIGGDPEDFVLMREMHATQELLEQDSDLYHLSYVGTVLPRSEPLVRTLLRGFARLRSTQPALASRIRLNFIGTSNQPNDLSTFRVRPFAEAEGVADCVREIPQRLPYLRALSWLAHSRGLLLIGSDEPHYTASKIYPALMSGRPYLSLFRRESSAHEILSAAGGGFALAFSRGEDLTALELPIAKALQELATSPESFGVTDPTAYGSYTADSVAKRFAAIFDRLVTERAARAG